MKGINGHSPENESGVKNHSTKLFVNNPLLRVIITAGLHWWITYSLLSANTELPEIPAPVHPSTRSWH